jgi:hypothetical protein
LGHECSQNFSFFVGQVFLLILVEYLQKVDMTTGFQIEVENAIPAPFSFTSSGIRASCFPDSSEPMDKVTANRIVEKIGLNETQHIQSCCSGDPVEALGENGRLDIYH